MSIGVGVSIGVWFSAARPHGGCKASWSFGRGQFGGGRLFECVRAVVGAGPAQSLDLDQSDIFLYL